MAQSRRKTRSRQILHVEDSQGIFMISVAAQLADMHPQTLRMYEARGLITPKRSPKGTRLYSQADVEHLRHIQQMTVEMGMNLSGVERVLELERQLERITQRAYKLEQRAQRLQAQMEAELDRVRRSLNTDLVTYKNTGSEIVLVRRTHSTRHR
jgi:MerR family transcriptional regulator/heat shock protein HspR